MNTGIEDISQEEKEKEMDKIFEILKKLKDIIIILKYYELEYDESWNKYIIILESAISYFVQMKQMIILLD